MWPQYLRAQIGRAARRALRPIGWLDYSVVYRLDLRQPLTPFKARIPIDVVIASDAELDEIQPITGSPFHASALLQQRANTGSKCLLAKQDGKIVGFNWTTFGVVYDEFYRITLDPQDAYCMDAHTIEPYRGNAIHTELLYRCLDYAKSQNAQHAYTRVSAMNVASWKSHLRLGWVEVGRTYLLWPDTPNSRFRFFGPTVYPVAPNQDYRPPVA
jgi:hypothetical protein